LLPEISPEPWGRERCEQESIEALRDIVLGILVEVAIAVQGERDG